MILIRAFKLITSLQQVLFTCFAMNWELGDMTSPGISRRLCTTKKQLSTLSNQLLIEGKKCFPAGNGSTTMLRIGLQGMFGISPLPLVSLDCILEVMDKAMQRAV